jgi:hypothetical protein
MSKINPARKQYRSMRGKQVDMDLLRKRNELTPAVGNAKVNARGDELGPGGQIIRKREELVQEHYAQAGKVRSDSGRAKPKADEVEPVVEETVKKTKSTRTAVKKESAPTVEEQAMLDEFDDEWVEDENGNFVPKGE